MVVLIEIYLFSCLIKVSLSLKLNQLTYVCNCTSNFRITCIWSLYIIYSKFQMDFSLLWKLFIFIIFLSLLFIKWIIIFQKRPIIVSLVIFRAFPNLLLSLEKQRKPKGPLWFFSSFASSFSSSLITISSLSTSKFVGDVVQC